MSDPANKAKTQLAAAEKKLKSWSFFGNKYEDASDILVQAASNFKLAKLWKEAAEAYLMLVDCHIKLQSSHEAASAYVDAANAYKKCSPSDAIKCLEKAIDLFQDRGTLSMAAKHHKSIGEMLEAEDLERAMFHYEQAADLYAGEDQRGTSNTCKLEVARLAATLEIYPKAIEIFEEVAHASLDNKLLKYSVKTYLMNSGLCQLCRGDAVAISNALQKYQELDPSFTGSRECLLLEELAQKYEDGDVDGYTRAVTEFDKMTKLDSWRTTLLLRVKRKITSLEDEGDLC
mmetsp:Transcript_15172/g.18292  ORF Transcript_15172/g.18292 Transcript_15172/m.18292 type:complete len:288 (-) Transcript_15172:1267-2130(-)|eukprot:CAMPEP_0197852392 /NCGR_PEP_ID=MMETSP1438-20131217/20488_1 /TAXON_ID=1461541 /ORGANISM="Pterosperma sp., Strain CCMP1384" /LENGTH=287 /DNA_ID=CAMNT_0043466435 /DNA_START=89 /DNA_END=952 /DNA_ORIENTATION=+